MNRILIALSSSSIVVIVYLLINATSFERIKPSIEMYVVKDKNTIERLNTDFFNPHNDIRLNVFDSSGLSSYSIKVTNKKNEVLLEKNEVLLKKSENLEIILPQIKNLKNGDEIFYNVNVRDWSNANLFRGNESSMTKHLIINDTTPKVQVIATSEQIAYGGSALIAFYIQDLPIYKKSKQKSISRVLVGNGHNEFEAYPFINKYGNLVYLSLIAWPIKNTFFEGTIRVVDSAMNESVIQIPIYTNIAHIRRKFNINISDHYIYNVIENISNNVKIPHYLISNIDKFQFFNESLRNQDNQKISNFFQINKRVLTQSNIPRFNTFNPINEATISGKFGDDYIYKYEKKNIGTSTRHGIELFNNEQKSIINSNVGEVAYIGNTSIYGNIVSINHQLGLNATYGYLESLPNISGNIQSLSTIGKVGMNKITRIYGVYFMTIVQGYFVDPMEWINPTWVDVNINQVLDKADNFNINHTRLDIEQKE